jgi:hypothetical protein
MARSSDAAGDQHVLEVLPRAEARPAVDVPAVAAVEPQPCALEDVGVELAAVVHDNEKRRAGPERLRRAGEHLGDPLDVAPESLAAPPAGRRPELTLAQVVEAEELVGVAVLLAMSTSPVYGGEVTTASKPAPGSTSRASP